MKINPILILAALLCQVSTSKASTLVYESPDGSVQIALGGDRNEKDPERFQMVECVRRHPGKRFEAQSVTELQRSPEARCKYVNRNPLAYVDMHRVVTQAFQDWQFVQAAEPGKLDSLIKSVETGIRMGIFHAYAPEPGLLVIPLRVGNTNYDIRMPRDASPSFFFRQLFSTPAFASAMQMALGYRPAVDSVAVRSTNNPMEFSALAQLYADLAKSGDSQVRNNAECEELVKSLSARNGQVEKSENSELQSLRRMVTRSLGHRVPEALMATPGNTCYQRLALLGMEYENWKLSEQVLGKTGYIQHSRMHEDVKRATLPQVIQGR